MNNQELLEKQLKDREARLRKARAQLARLEENGGTEWEKKQLQAKISSLDELIKKRRLKMENDSKTKSDAEESRPGVSQDINSDDPPSRGHIVVSSERNFSNIEHLLEEVIGKTCDEISYLGLLFRDCFAYEGFDPKHMAEVLIKKCNNRADVVKNAVVVTSFVLVERGSKIKKIADKSNRQLAIRLRMLSLLLTKRQNKKLTRNCLTLQRIAALVPELMAREVTDYNKMVLGNWPLEVPALIRSLFLAPCLPFGSEWANVAKVNLLYQLEFEHFVRPKSPAKVEALATFWTASHGSKILCENSRVALMKQLRITPTCCDDFIRENAERLSKVQVPTFAQKVVNELVLPPLGIPSSLPLNCSQRGRPEGSLEKRDLTIGRDEPKIVDEED